MISIWGFLYFSILCILLSRKIIYGKPGAGKRQGLPYLTERESKYQSAEPIIITWHIYRCTAGIRCTTGHNHILPAQFNDFHLGLNVLYSTPPARFSMFSMFLSFLPVLPGVHLFRPPLQHPAKRVSSRKASICRSNADRSRYCASRRRPGITEDKARRNGSPCASNERQRAG